MRTISGIKISEETLNVFNKFNIELYDDPFKVIHDDDPKLKAVVEKHSHYTLLFMNDTRFSLNNKMVGKLTIQPLNELESQLEDKKQEIQQLLSSHNIVFDFTETFGTIMAIYVSLPEESFLHIIKLQELGFSFDDAYTLWEDNIDPDKLKSSKINLNLPLDVVLVLLEEN